MLGLVLGWGIMHEASVCRGKNAVICLNSTGLVATIGTVSRCWSYLNNSNWPLSVLFWKNTLPSSLCLARGFSKQHCGHCCLSNLIPVVIT